MILVIITALQAARLHRLHVTDDVNYDTLLFEVIRAIGATQSCIIVKHEYDPSSFRSQQSHVRDLMTSQSDAPSTAV